MDNITLEKVIDFDSLIDSIDTININDQIKYEILENNTHGTGTIQICGSVNTLTGKHDFKEEVDVDIYTQDNKKIEQEKFKIVVKDYSYTINKQSLSVYLVLQIEGIIEVDDVINESNINNDNEVLVNYDNIVDSINNINDINTSDRNSTNNENLTNSLTDNNIIQEVKENINVKTNVNEDNISSNWANDLFKLTETYEVFYKVHLE